MSSGSESNGKASRAISSGADSVDMSRLALGLLSSLKLAGMFTSRMLRHSAKRSGDNHIFRVSSCLRVRVCRESLTWNTGFPVGTLLDRVLCHQSSRMPGGSPCGWTGEPLYCSRPSCSCWLLLSHPPALVVCDIFLKASPQLQHRRKSKHSPQPKQSQ